MQLNFPAYNFKVKTEENTNYVFDIVRKKFVALTPEEWVRQHLLHFLIQERGYPASLLSIERGLEMNGLRKRFDVLVFGKDAKPLLLVECKSPAITLDEATFMQAAVYNSNFGAKHLLITNGLNHVHCRYEAGNPPQISFIIPGFTEL